MSEGCKKPRRKESPRRELTDRLCASLTSKGLPQWEYYDGMCAGLSLRVTIARKKFWSFTFTNPVGGKRARMDLGTYPATSLADARKRAVIARSKMEGGEDPRSVQAPVAAPLSIAELINQRIEMELRPKKRRSVDEIEWRFGKYVTPLVGSVAVKDFEIAPHYNSVIDPLVSAGTMRMAGVVFQDLRALFNFAVRRGVIKYSALACVERPDEPVARTRFLSLEEIKIVWHALPMALTRSKHTPTILRLALMTGQRLNEVAGMRKAEFDFSTNTPFWTIPASRAKNGFEHVVPLCGSAVDMIRDAIKAASGEFLFSNSNGTASTTVNVIDYAVRKALPKIGIPQWVPHDLRRTVGTQMLSKKNGLILNRQDGLGISRFDRELVLNHRTVTKAGVGDIHYDGNDYFDEKRAALETWGVFLMALVSGIEPANDAVALIAAE